MAPYYDHQVGRFEPPAPPDQRLVLMARARRARAETTADLFRALHSGLESVAKGIVEFAQYAGYGAAKMPPQGGYLETPAHLTGSCR